MIDPEYTGYAWLVKFTGYPYKARRVQVLHKHHVTNYVWVKNCDRPCREHCAIIGDLFHDKHEADIQAAHNNLQKAKTTQTRLQRELKRAKKDVIDYTKALEEVRNRGKND